MALVERGHVYILTSPKTDLIKIGGTIYPPMKRIKEINNSNPYKTLGPWTLSDFREVSDWRKVEYHLHYIYRHALASEIEGQKELFKVSALDVAGKLNLIDANLIIRKPKIDKMFQDSEFSSFILKFFKFTGILNWLDIQGAWVFVPFPSTNGNRYYTLNIGRHEVAFSVSANKGSQLAGHCILMDRLILDFEQVGQWVRSHDGSIYEGAYKSALPRSVNVSFAGDFTKAKEFLDLPGVRRALIAYWNEALIGLKENDSLSLFSKHHNWNAVAEIRSRLLLQG